MKSTLHEAEESMARRNEADIRMVQAVVGMLTGGGVGILIDMQMMRHALHPPLWFLIFAPVVGATLGACIGYYQRTWRSAE